MDYKGTDYYCDVAIPKKVSLEIEYESDTVLAFRHTHPYCEVHIVVVPKQHIDSLLSIDDSNRDIFNEMIVVIQEVAERVSKEHGAARILTNLGEYQDSKHLHFHIAFGDPLDN
jgi:histidine triad (HIT) family protein